MSLNENPIDRPIFILGNARSGSTMFYHLCAGHPDLAWFSNYTVKFSLLPQLALLSPLFPWRHLNDLPRGIEIFIPKPAEGQPLYARCSGDRHSFLDSSDAVPSQVNCIKHLVLTHLKYHRRSRFINKSIGNWRRISYLNAIFPDAKFLHVVRDPRANTASYLNWWLRPNYQEIWQAGSFPPEKWESQVKPLIVSRAEEWVEVNQTIAEAETLLGNRYFRISYEDLAADPCKVMGRILDHCELAWTPKYREFIQRSSVRNMNEKYRKQFRQREFDLIETITAPLVNQFGYSYFSG